MANNALIRGAAFTGKKFLDVGGAVAAGAAATSAYVPDDRVAENKAIQNRVNSYMGKMKTDMDFTSFSPSETKTMRNFLLSQRTKYTDAAKKAAEFDDTTDPNYMMYVDEMQNVNNSFTNLASQLKSYKQGKVEYAKTMQEGLYSNGNVSRRSKEAAIIYGFYDADGDNRSDARYDAPFQIQDGGNIAFNVGGQEITYNGMEEPFFKDTKFLNSLSATSEKAYNSGLRGNANNPYAQDAYKQKLNDTLQNEDALRSIIFDFDPEAPMLMQNPNDPTGPQIKIGTALDSGIIDLKGARDLVNERLLKAREDAYIAGKTEYDIKQAKLKKEINSLNNPNQAAANLAAEFKLSSGLTDVELFHPNHPTKKESYEIRATSEGGYEWRQKGGNTFFPLEAENVFNLDISKINISGAVSGDDEIGYSQQLYDDIKALLGIRGIPTAEQDLEIIAKMNEI